MYFLLICYLHLHSICIEFEHNNRAFFRVYVCKGIYFYIEIHFDDDKPSPENYSIEMKYVVYDKNFKKNKQLAVKSFKYGIFLYHSRIEYIRLP